jgi:hypothetical protein
MAKQADAYTASVRNVAYEALLRKEAEHRGVLLPVVEEAHARQILASLLIETLK